MRTIDATQLSECRDGPLAVHGMCHTAGHPGSVSATELNRLLQLLEDTADFPVPLIAASVVPSAPLPERFESVKLDQLVLQCLDMTPFEAEILAKVFGEKPCKPLRTAESFYKNLQIAINECHLGALFAPVDGANWHRSIVPGAYNERTGQVYPDEMAKWRADFRAMAPECQMMAATIVWLYRAGSDSIWLRRVPTSWRAVEALRYMRDADVLDLWVNMITTYPGW